MNTQVFRKIMLDNYSYRFAVMCFGLGFLFLIVLYGIGIANNRDTGNLGNIALGVGTFLSGLLVVPKKE